MPWTTDDPPAVAKNRTAAERQRCVSAANAALADGATDEEAIFACIANMGESEQSSDFADISTTPPDDVRAAYRNGLKRHEAGETGAGLEPITVRMARHFAAGGAATEAWARKGARWWARNARFAEAEPGTPAYAAALLWGGRDWFSSIIKRLESDKMSERFWDKLVDKVTDALGLQERGYITTTTADFAAPTLTQVHVPAAGDAEMMSKEDVSYRETGSGGCATCTNRAGGGCRIVEGGGEDGYICDQWTAQEEMSEAFFVHFAKAEDGWALVFPLGTFYRDGRKREFTDEQAREMVDNFNGNILGRLPPINKEHIREAGRIARFTALEYRPGADTPGVYGLPKEVEGYEGALRGFDFLSPEVRWTWTHPETGKQHKNVLMGAAATNYPFFLGKMALHSGGGVPFAKSDVASYLWGGDEWEETDAYQDLEDLRKVREARASRYGIGVKKDGALTPPKDYPTDEALYGDPTNYAYPCDKERALPAVQYFNHSGQREKGGYTPEEWSIIGKRIAKLAGKALGVDYQYKNGRVERKEEAASEPVAFTHNEPLAALDEAQRIVYGVVFQPDTPDSQGHIISAEAIEATAHDFAARLQGVNLDEQHRRLVQSDECKIVESWIQKEPTVWRFADNEIEVPVGAWCMAVKIFSDDLWSDVLAGEITGFSPVGKATGRAAIALDDYGGPGSGNWAHKGTPGRGGSAPGGGLIRVGNSGTGDPYAPGGPFYKPPPQTQTKKGIEGELDRERDALFNRQGQRIIPKEGVTREQAERYYERRKISDTAKRSPWRGNHNISVADAIDGYQADGFKIGSQGGFGKIELQRDTKGLEIGAISSITLTQKVEQDYAKLIYGKIPSLSGK